MANVRRLNSLLMVLMISPPSCRWVSTSRGWKSKARVRRERDYVWLAEAPHHGDRRWWCFTYTYMQALYHHPIQRNNSALYTL